MPNIESKVKTADLKGPVAESRSPWQTNSEGILSAIDVDSERAITENTTPNVEHLWIPGQR